MPHTQGTFTPATAAHTWSSSRRLKNGGRVGRSLRSFSIPNVSIFNSNEIRGACQFQKKRKIPSLLASG